MSPLRAGDAPAYRNLFNFHIKCQAMGYGDQVNPSETRKIIWSIL